MKPILLLLSIVLVFFSTDLYAIPPTHPDIAYGPDVRHKLDLWIPDSAATDKPLPVLVCIHGGGFRNGDKSKFANNTPLLTTMLDAGISVVAINYRRVDGGANAYPAPMLDGARAVQFLRYSSQKYQLDKSRIICTGGSAGGCMSLWLAFHDDLADPNNEDPILRESSRLTAAAPNAGQSCLHLPTLLKWFEVDSLIEHPSGRPLFGVSPEESLTQNKRLEALSLDASPITHLSKDDPPVYMSYPENVPINDKTEFRTWVHHPTYGIKLKEAMGSVGLESHLRIKGAPQTSPYANEFEFIIDKLTKE